MSPALVTHPPDEHGGQTQAGYEQASGGCVRFVRWKVTSPAGELNSAVEGFVKVSVPSSKGLFQPWGGFPLPSDDGRVARQNRPSIFAQ